MAKGVFIQVQGFKELEKKLGSLPVYLVTEMDAELSAASLEFEDRAQAAARVDTGYMRNHITHSKLAPMQYEVVSSAPYSAYHEFGTITRVSIPQGLEAYAAEFKGRGIRKTGGIVPKPFFFPQVPIARAQINEAGKRILNSIND